MTIRLPSNLRQTNRRRAYFLSHASTISKNPTLHANFTAMSSTESELLPIEVLHCRNKEFCAFRSRDLDLDPMTFMYELDPYPLEISSQTKNKLSTSRVSKVIVLNTHTHRQTDIRTYVQTERCYRKHYHSASRVVKTLLRVKTLLPTLSTI